MSGETWTILGVGVVLLGVLVPLLLALISMPNRAGAHLEDRLEEQLHALTERVPRVEGVLTGPVAAARARERGPEESDPGGGVTRYREAVEPSDSPRWYLA